MQTSDSKKKAKLRFNTAAKVEKKYMRHLRQVAKQIASLVNAFAPNGVVEDMAGLQDSLRKYSEILRPWATLVAGQMVGDVQRKDEQAWDGLSKSLGRALRKELQDAPTGAALRKMLAENVHLIQSLPLDAAKRVHELTVEQLGSPTVRAKELSEQIAATGHVTETRALLIARTEVARTASYLTAARAEHVGSTHYYWRTAEDADVRSRHKKLNGKIFSWNDPPVSGENGERSLPGAIYNCRCYPEPILE